MDYIAYGVVGLVLLALTVCAYYLLRPVWREGTVSLARLVPALVIVAVVAFVAAEMGTEIYRCDVLGIPNCD